MIIPYTKIRKTHYDNQFKKLRRDFDIDLNSSPYTKFKSIIYIELSSILIFFLQNKSITPNVITLIYALTGVIGGILLSTGNNKLIIIATIMFFFKSFLDWSDGYLAKIKNKTSELGAVLDEWGGFIGYYSFLCGFGILLFKQTEQIIYLILTLLIVFSKICDLKFFIYLTTLDKLKEKKISKIEIVNKKKNVNKKYKTFKIANFFKNFFDDRARTYDFISLLILIDIFYYDTLLPNLIFYLICTKFSLAFFWNFYLVFFKDFLSQFKFSKND